MKLLFCPRCRDIVPLHFSTRKCMCGHSSGRYEEDGLKATIFGKGMCIGIHNRHFVNAEQAMRYGKDLDEKRAKELGDFKAWFFHPKHAPNVTYKEKDE